MDRLLIAEPLPVNYKSEVAIARLTDVLQRAELTQEQRAQLYYDRGVRYDSVGLVNLARLDFNRALRLKPDLYDAYNFIGIQFTQLQEFIQAYDAFDSVLDLKPDHKFAYFNRGIALYYGERPQLAISDLTFFQQQKIDDPYRLLWLYFAETEVDAVEAKKQLKIRAQQIPQTIWAKRLIDLYLNEISLSKFTQELTYGINSEQALTERLCETYFYLGKLSLLNNEENIAANYFKLALSTNVFEFVEHRYSRLELALLKAHK
jgi:lipoprotein NlpI